MYLMVNSAWLSYMAGVPSEYNQLISGEPQVHGGYTSKGADPKFYEEGGGGLASVSTRVRRQATPETCKT